jgi:hypothetical protein
MQSKRRDIKQQREREREGISGETINDYKNNYINKSFRICTNEL